MPQVRQGDHSGQHLTAVKVVNIGWRDPRKGTASPCNKERQPPPIFHINLTLGQDVFLIPNMAISLTLSQYTYYSLALSQNFTFQGSSKWNWISLWWPLLMGIVVWIYCPLFYRFPKDYISQDVHTTTLPLVQYPLLEILVVSFFFS